MYFKTTFEALLVALLGLTAACLAEGEVRGDSQAERRDQVESRDRTPDRERPGESEHADAVDGSGVSESPEASTESNVGGSTGSSGLEPEVAHGEALFEQNCSACHGGDARGTKSGPSLRPIAGQLTEGDGESTVRGQISSGGKRMPSFSHLEEDEVDALVAYLRHLGTKVDDSEVAAGSSDADSERRKSKWRRGKRGWRGGNRGKWRRKRRGRRRNGSEEESSNEERGRDRRRGCRNRRR